MWITYLYSLRLLTIVIVRNDAYHIRDIVRRPHLVVIKEEVKPNFGFTTILRTINSTL